MKKKDRETLALQGAADLVEKEKEIREASWKLRLQKSTGQLENPTRLRVLRRSNSFRTLSWVPPAHK